MHGAQELALTQLLLVLLCSAFNTAGALPALLLPFLQLGKQDIREARAVSNRLLGLGIGGGVALAAAFWLAEPVIPTIFTNDPGGFPAWAPGRGARQERQFVATGTGTAHRLCPVGM